MSTSERGFPEVRTAVAIPDGLALGADAPAAGRSPMLYYGVLAYTVFFYSRLSERVPVLGAIRAELLFGAILVAGCLAAIVSGRVRFGESSLHRAAVLFLLAATVTVPFAYVKTRALNQLIELLKFFTIYIMLIATLDTERRLRGFLAVYLTMIAIIFLEPFLLSLGGKGFIYNNHMLRLAGTTRYFGHPNQLGGITAEHIPFFYYFALLQRSWVRKVGLLLLVGAMIRVVMLTQSRTGFLGVITCAFFILVFSRRRGRAVVVSVLLAVSAVLLAPPQTRDRFLTLGKVDTVMTTDRSEMSTEEAFALGSMANRLELVKHGFVAFRENPVIGLGLDCFSSFNGRRYGDWLPPHNTFIQALAEMGMLGFGIFLFVLYSIGANLREAWRILRPRAGPRTFQGATCQAVAVYLLARVVVGSFGQDLYANYWWVAGGLSVAVLRLARGQVARGAARGGGDGLPGRAA